MITAHIAQSVKTARVDEQWQAAADAPTRYAIIDNLLPDDMARSIHDAFDPTHFASRASFRERKKTSARFDVLPSILADITFAFQKPEVTELINGLLGIEGAAGDPTLYAGGLSMMGRGDFLNPHIDNSHNADRSRYRRLNLLYYVTPDWHERNGGSLELWDHRVRNKVTIPAHFNRLVLMETNRRSWHSVDRVSIDRARCCVSNYYFSTRSPSGGDYFHVTEFSARPEQPALRAIAKADALARSVAGQLGLGRGKRQRFVQVRT